MMDSPAQAAQTSPRTTQTQQPPLRTDRAKLFARLSTDKTYDLAIIGGGATGLGLALDAASRGYSVVLIDATDFAKGTSSRSTKLVHGGVRYLAQGNVSLVYEALHERTTLLHNAAHLAQPLLLFCLATSSGSSRFTALACFYMTHSQDGAA